MQYAKVFLWSGELVIEGQMFGGKHWTEKYQEQYVSLGSDDRNESIEFDHIEGEQYFQEFDEKDNMLYDSRTHEEHEWYEFEDCSYKYPGCTTKSTTYFNSGVSCVNYPCCESCYNKREEKQREINRKYNDIAPFSGQNDYGEYYDQDSY